MKTCFTAIELAPKYGTAYRNLAMMYFREGEYALAIENYDRAIELGYSADPEFERQLKEYRREEAK
ncbi:MAG: tetratricopeptide repeat protein [Candidatus Omnitrophica bacterium]|nr:tetratricopeptide repeat protein [Candidatus Omnitrophota bacterium]